MSFIKKMKKGVSPLIATVLLIGFTIAVVALIVLWGRGYVSEKAEKQGALAEARLKCQSLDFSVMDLKGGEITLKNKGTVDIDSFVLRGKKGAESADVEIVRQPLKSLSMGSFPISKLNLNNILTMEIIPQLRVSSNVYVPCTAQSVEIRVA